MGSHQAHYSTGGPTASGRDRGRQFLNHPGGRARVAACARGLTIAESAAVTPGCIDRARWDPRRPWLRRGDVVDDGTAVGVQQAEDLVALASAGDQATAPGRSWTSGCSEAGCAGPPAGAGTGARRGGRHGGGGHLRIVAVRIDIVGRLVIVIEDADGLVREDGERSGQLGGCGSRHGVRAGSPSTVRATGPGLPCWGPARASGDRAALRPPARRRSCRCRAALRRRTCCDRRLALARRRRARAPGRCGTGSDTRLTGTAPPGRRARWGRRHRRSARAAVLGPRAARPWAPGGLPPGTVDPDPGVTAAIPRW